MLGTGDGRNVSDYKRLFYRQDRAALLDGHIRADSHPEAV